MRKQTHFHKYERTKIGENYFVFKCMVPGCNHYIQRKLAVNRIAACWRCDQPFILTKYSLKRKRPHCINCTKSKRREIHDKIKELLLASD